MIIFLPTDNRTANIDRRCVMGWMTHRMTWFDWITLPFGLFLVLIWAGFVWVKNQTVRLGNSIIKLRGGRQ